MTRIEKGKYSVLIRDDYLAKLPSDRDDSIQQAIRFFLLDCSAVQQREATNKQRVHIMRSADAKPEFYMWLQHINVPDEVVEDLKESAKYADLDRILNAAIKLWLRSQGKDIKD